METFCGKDISVNIRQKKTLTGLDVPLNQQGCVVRTPWNDTTIYIGELCELKIFVKQEEQTTVIKKDVARKQMTFN